MPFKNSVAAIASVTVIFASALSGCSGEPSAIRETFAGQPHQNGNKVPYFSTFERVRGREILAASVEMSDPPSGARAYVSSTSTSSGGSSYGTESSLPMSNIVLLDMVSGRTRFVLDDNEHLIQSHSYLPSADDSSQAPDASPSNQDGPAGPSKALLIALELGETTSDDKADTISWALYDIDTGKSRIVLQGIAQTRHLATLTDGSISLVAEKQGKTFHYKIDPKTLQVTGTTPIPTQK